MYNVVPAICSSMMLLNQTQSYSCECYLEKGSLSHVGLPHRTVEKNVIFLKVVVKTMLCLIQGC